MSNATDCPICGEYYHYCYDNYRDTCGKDICVNVYLSKKENEEQLSNIKNILNEILTTLQTMNQRISVLEEKLSID